jgi:hypothetical protein
VSGGVGAGVGFGGGVDVGSTELDGRAGLVLGIWDAADGGGKSPASDGAPASSDDPGNGPSLGVALATAAGPPTATSRLEAGRFRPPIARAIDAARTTVPTPAITAARLRLGGRFSVRSLVSAPAAGTRPATTLVSVAAPMVSATVTGPASAITSIA